MTLEEVKAFLKIDSNYEDSVIESFIDQAEIYIDFCVGEGYKTNPKKVKLAELLTKKIVGDLYKHREANLNSKGGYDRVSSTILDILSLSDGVENA